ncbi:extracellular solute-binding protein [Amaricoccus tamworthensis]|uniref:extracellular solute-binding protein n=1 Tax=Amaricoccus tamworthensis TaxID=57002 RepID=UPI003C7C5AC2
MQYSGVPYTILRGLLVCLMVAGRAFAQDGETDRIALVIGNSDYVSVPALANPRNDAEAISDKLEALGFRVIERTDLGLEATRDAIIEFGRASYGAEVALVFYAGHGMQMNGENYLLPVDSRVENPDAVVSSSLREAELHAAFAFSQPDVAVLILDACRTDPSRHGLPGSPGLSSGNAASHELGRIRSSAGLLIVFSAAPGAVARDGEDGNSPFTTALLQWIDQPDLEVGPMVRRVRQTVWNLTNGSQIPWVEESLIDDVYLGPRLEQVDRATRELAELLTTTIAAFEHPVERHAAVVVYTRLLPGVDFSGTDFTLAALEVDNLSMERPPDQESLVWLSIRESSDHEIFRSFIAEYPNSLFVPLAEQRIAGLTDGEVEVPPSLPDVPEDPAAVEVDQAVLAATEASLGLDRADWRGFQVLLAQAGYYAGPIDGLIGAGSRGGLAAFQEANGFLPSGYLDDVTLLRLVGLTAGAALGSEAGRTHRGAIHRLAAIAQQGPGAEAEVIRVATHQRFPEVHDYWRGIADTYEAEHPGTMIEYDVRPDIQYKEDLLLMLGSETPPDIYLTYGGGHLRSVAEAGFARDLTEEMGAGLALRYKPGALTNLMVGDRIFAVPMRMTLISLWANRRLLAEAGVVPEDLETWEGFVDAVRALRAAGITPLAAGAEDAWPVGIYWGMFAQALGGRGVVDDALAGRGEGFRADAFLRAGGMLADLAGANAFQPDLTGTSESEATGMFVGGNAAMSLNGDWLRARAARNWPGGAEAMAEELVRVSFPPRDLGVDGALTYGGVDSWVINDEAPEAAVDFVSVLAGLESQTAIAGMGFGIPAIAGADTAIGDAMLAEVAGELTLSEYHQLYLNEVLGPYAGGVMDDAAVAVALGDLSPVEAAAAVEAAWEEIREEWGDVVEAAE